MLMLTHNKIIKLVLCHSHLYLILYFVLVMLEMLVIDIFCNQKGAFELIPLLVHKLSWFKEMQ